MRTAASALSIVAGALAILGWLLSSAVVSSLEDGSVAATVVERAFDDDAVVAGIASVATDEAMVALGERGLDGILVEAAVGAAVRAAVGSEQFASAVVAAVDSQREQVAQAITDPDRASAPLVILVDISPYLNDTIDGLPVLGSAVPDVALEPVPIELASAERTDQLRGAYVIATWLERWGLWLGGALLAVGLLVSHRKKWLIPKFSAVVAVLALAAWVLIVTGWVVPLANALPGPGLGILSGVVADGATPTLTWTLLAASGVAAVVAAGSTAVVRSLNRTPAR